MIITNKLGFAIVVILGVLLALFLLGKLLIWIAESQPEVPEERTNRVENTKPQQHKPEYAKGYGNGCSQLIALLLGIILLLIAILR